MVDIWEIELFLSGLEVRVTISFLFIFSVPEVDEMPVLDFFAMLE